MVGCTNLMRHAGFAVGVLCMVMAGTIYSFNAFANSLKLTFQLTQSQVEVIASLGNFGTCAGFPAGWMYQRFGPTWTMGVALAGTTGGYALLWSTVANSEFYHDNWWLLAVFYCVASHGAIYMYMASLMTVMLNFSPKHRGKVVGVLDSSYGVSAAIFSGIYSAAFAKGHTTDGREELQDLRGFLLLLTVCFACVCFLGILFVKRIPREPEVDRRALLTNSVYNVDYGVFHTDSSGLSTDSRDSRGGESETSSVDSQVNITGMTLLKNWDFQFLLWTFLLAGAVGLMFMNNITAILKSLDMSEHAALFVVLIPLASAVSRCAAGFISDLLLPRMPRAAILLPAILFLTASLALCVFFVTSFGVLVMTSVAVGMSYGVLWCISPTLTSEEFGMAHFGSNWGWVMFASAAAAEVLQQAFGAIYDSHLPSGGGTCYGASCFTWSMVMAASVSACALLLNVGLWERAVFRRNDPEEMHVRERGLVT